MAMAECKLFDFTGIPIERQRVMPTRLGVDTSGMSDSEVIARVKHAEQLAGAKGYNRAAEAKPKAITKPKARKGEGPSAARKLSFSASRFIELVRTATVAR